MVEKSIQYKHLLAEKIKFKFERQCWKIGNTLQMTSGGKAFNGLIHYNVNVNIVEVTDETIEVTYFVLCDTSDPYYDFPKRYFEAMYHDYMRDVLDKYFGTVTQKIVLKYR